MTRRTAVHVDGLDHGVQPIPMASRIGDLVWSGGVGGFVPGSHDVAEAIEDEAAQMFRNLEAIVQAAGGTTDDVIRVSVHVRDRAEARDAVNAAWVAMFPDEASRPARHTTVLDLMQPMRVQCEFIAVLGGAS